MSLGICDAVPIHRLALTGTEDEQTYQTLAHMKQLAVWGMQEPAVRRVAETAVAGIPSGDQDGEIRAIWAYLKQHFVYRQDPEPVEWLQAPHYLVQCSLDRGQQAVGDCDDASMLSAALLGSLGYRTAFTVVSTRPSQEFNHVFVTVHRDGRNPVDFDLTENPRHQYRREDYPLWQDVAAHLSLPWILVGGLTFGLAWCLGRRRK